MTIEQFIDKINHYASHQIPFFFISDFEGKTPWVCRLEDADKHGYYFNVNGKTNCTSIPNVSISPTSFQITPIDFEYYKTAFKTAHEHLSKGNTYLLNLTFPSKIETNKTLLDIYQNTKAKYKLYVANQFVLFSPECFIKIKAGHIYSYPMKGTIDATLLNAREQLLQNEKEIWEHNTIVDLIRNDLGMVSEEVTVTKFRYIDHLRTHKNELLQVSSEIRGRLPNDWQSQLGEIILKLLPAGSISGAPKQKTVDIIKNIELDDRKYYTGVFGIFDGETLDTAVNIRFLEKTDKAHFLYRSGGGLTFWSNLEEEYQELINKIYVPTF